MSPYGHSHHHATHHRRDKEPRYPPPPNSYNHYDQPPPPHVGGGPPLHYPPPRPHPPTTTPPSHQREEPPYPPLLPPLREFGRCRGILIYLCFQEMDPYGHNHHHTTHHRHDEEPPYPPPPDPYSHYDQPPPPHVGGGPPLHYPPPPSHAKHPNTTHHCREEPPYPPPPPPHIELYPPPPPHAPTPYTADYYLPPPPPPPLPIHDVSHESSHHSPHMPPIINHHQTCHKKEPEKYTDNKPTVRVYTKAKTDYSLTIREGKVILAPSNPSDPHQHWIKDEKFSISVKDEQGFPSFALVNKATGQAMKHSIGATYPVQLTKYNPDKLDESVLWTQGKDLGDGYRAVRTVHNIQLNVDAFKGVKDHGGVHDGTDIVLWEWNKGDNQRWTMVPY